LLRFLCVLTLYGVFQFKSPSSRSRARSKKLWGYSVGEGFPLPPIIAKITVCSLSVGDGASTSRSVIAKATVCSLSIQEALFRPCHPERLGFPERAPLFWGFAAKFSLRFHLRSARCCFAVRLRYAPLRMTQGERSRTRRAMQSIGI